MENNKIDILGIVDEDFVNYKKPSMFITFPYCTFKCEKYMEGICQNRSLIHDKKISMDFRDIVRRYLDNPISKAIVFGGLEPFDSKEMYDLIKEFRLYTTDDIVIYTGYNPDEVQDTLIKIEKFPNIIIKFGRFIPNDTSEYNDILGVTLASSNQFACAINMLDDISVNTDHNHVLKIWDAIDNNDGHCPCQIHKDDSTLCVCKSFKLNHECHCNVYD